MNLRIFQFYFILEGIAALKLFTSKSFLLGMVFIGLIAYFSLAFVMSMKPGAPGLANDSNQQPGVATVSMIIDQMETQLNSTGGWLPNDPPLTPGAFLDNLPNFQLGVLQVVRHSGRVLRDNLTRQRTSDAVHKEADLAYTGYANNPFKWAFPSAEGAFRQGNEALRLFRADLGGEARFFPRADNLIQLMEPFISELGAVTTRLLEARNSDKVSWFEVDDNFYYAQGVGFAMLGMMKAVREDFKSVLNDKNALEITDLIIQSLEESQFDPLFITNGDKNGVLANHSNNLKVYLDDARQKMNSLISILDQG